MDYLHQIAQATQKALVAAQATFSHDMQSAHAPASVTPPKAASLTPSLTPTVTFTAEDLTRLRRAMYKGT